MKLRKVLGLVVCISLVLSTFAACSDNKADETTGTEKQAGGESTPSTEKNPGSGARAEITYWQHSSQAKDNVMKSFAFDFMQANPEINVKMEFIPFADYSTKLISSLATNAAPDIMTVESGMISRLVKADAIQAIDESIIPMASIQSDFIAASTEALQVNGKLYGMPTDVQTIVLYWNKDLVKAEGLDAEKGPQTWDELLEWAKKLTKYEGGKMVQSGWGESGYNPEVQALIAQYGGKVADDAGKFIFAEDPKSVEAIKFLVDTYKVHKVYDKQFMANWAAFRVGKLAMNLGHPAMMGNLKLTAPDVKLGAGLIPTLNGQHTTILSSWSFSISKNADSQNAAKFLQYITSEDAQRRLTAQIGEIPSRKALLSDEALTKDPMTKLMFSSLNDSIVSRWQTLTLNAIWSEGYDKLILTDEPFDAVMKKLQDDMNAEMAKDLK